MVTLMMKTRRSGWCVWLAVAVLLLTTKGANSLKDFNIRAWTGDPPIQSRGGGGGDSRASRTEQPQKPLKFYIFTGGLCPFAGRTWIVLNELSAQIKFDFEYVDYKHKPESFYIINPRGRVPAIYNPNDGTVVYESAICNEYLCDLVVDGGSSPITTLMPSTASERGKLRLLNDKFDQEIFPKVRTYIMNERDDEEADALRKDCEAALQELDDQCLVDSSGPYFMGKEFTLADVHAVPFVMRWIPQLRYTKGFMVSRYPNLMKWYEVCQTRPSVQAATIPEDKIMEIHYLKMKFKQNGSATLDDAA